MYRSGALDPGRYAGVSQDRTTLRYGSADPRNVRERLAEGATLVVEQMDRLVPAIGEMTEAMRCWLRCPVDTVAYATVGSAGGFGAHFDDNDVIAVHLDGAKRWRIWEPTRAYPLHRDVARPPRPVSEPAREITLEPGDVMYLPRGWWHEATTPGGAAVSLHLTMRVHRRTGVDWLAWLADQLRSSGALSADLPEFASDLERARHRQRLLEELVRSADEQDWSRFVQAEGVDAAG